MGRGQLGQPAYTDVKNNRHSHLGIALQECLTRVRLAKLLSNAPAYARDFDMSTYRVKIPTSYHEVWQEPPVEDFVVVAYLAIRIIAATKNGRSPKDTAYFTIAKAI